MLLHDGDTQIMQEQWKGNEFAVGDFIHLLSDQ